MDENQLNDLLNSRCSSVYNFYKYKQELSQKSMNEKTEASIKFMCDVWGYQTFFFVLVFLVLVFHKHFFDMLVKKFPNLIEAGKENKNGNIQ